MSLRTSLKNLIRRDPAASLRDRADELRGSLPRTASPKVDPTDASHYPFV